MKMQVSAEALRKRPLFVATPMYGGLASIAYVRGLLNLNSVMVQYGLRMEHFSFANESLITRARNYCAHEFMRGTCTHMIFIDADIEFRPDDVISLLDWADPDSDKDVICGLYPKKHVCWDKIALAAKRNVEPSTLPQYGSDMVFNPCDLHGTFNLGLPLEVTECGTGFMMIQRRVFEKFEKIYPEMSYVSDGCERLDRKPGKILACFETHIENGRYLSEDYNFCRIVRQMGMKVWVAPWLELNHLGNYKFVGNPQALSESVIEKENEAWPKDRFRYQPGRPPQQVIPQPLQTTPTCALDQPLVTD